MKKYTEQSRRMQSLFQETAPRVAGETKFIKRVRKIDPTNALKALVFACMHHKQTTLEDFVASFKRLNVDISQQAVAKHLDGNAVAFFKEMCGHALKTLVNKNEEPLPLLDRFNGVYIDDCSTIKMPAALANELPGCGGGVGGNDVKNTAAAIKVLCRFEVTTGQYNKFIFGAGKTNDNKLEAEAEPLPSGSLHLTDMGFFSSERFSQEASSGVYFISRVPAGTNIGDAESRQSLTSFLQGLTENADIDTFVGERAFPVRLIAIRVPKSVADKRRKRIEKEKKRKGKTISADQLELCNWTVFITNIPRTLCTVDEIETLYSVRWQIELVFKLWKSECALDKSHGRSGNRCLCEFYIKLLVVIIVNWLMLSRGGMLSGVSATKQFRSIRRDSVLLLEIDWSESGGLSRELERIVERLALIKPQRRRKKHPSTREKLLKYRTKSLS